MMRARPNFERRHSDESLELPEGWTVTTLRNAAHARLGKTPRKSDYRNAGVHRILKFRDIRDGALDYSSSKAGFVTDNRDALAGLRPLLLGDVLLTASAHSGDQIGKKCAYVDRLPDADGGVFFVGELLGITADKRVVLDKWPYYWFLSEAGIDAVQSAVAGVHLTAGRAQNILIPVAPLSEQERIAAALERALAHLKVADDHLSQVPTILKRFRQAVLAAACSGTLTEDWRETNIRSSKEDWLDAELSDVCASISDGDHQPPPKQTSGVPFLTIGNISSGRLDFAQTRHVSEKYFDKIKTERKPRRGDVLYSVVGATIGIPVIVDVDRPFCFQRHIALLRASNQTTPEFLWVLMASPGIFKEGWSRVTGTAQPTLPLGNLRTIPIRVPPLAEQDEIVRRVQVLFELADNIERSVRLGSLRADKLTQSILAKAFRGELVPTEAELARREGREYEPASVLLERIKTEREVRTSQKPERKRRIPTAKLTMAKG